MAIATLDIVHAAIDIVPRADENIAAAKFEQFGVEAFRAEVGNVRFLIDTGHVADWGGDPCELLHLADHVQLRQGKPGMTQNRSVETTCFRRVRSSR